jgi:hypothetical protein
MKWIKSLLYISVLSGFISCGNGTDSSGSIEDTSKKDTIKDNYNPAAPGASNSQ